MEFLVNDDSDDSDSHDDEDEEEIDRIIAVADRVRMDTAYSPAEAHTPNNEDRTPQN